MKGIDSKQSSNITASVHAVDSTTQGENKEKKSLIIGRSSILKESSRNLKYGSL